MINFKNDEKLAMLNHSCAHVMAQAIKHLYPQAKFWVGPVVEEGFYYDVDLGDDVIRDVVYNPDNRRGATGYTTGCYVQRPVGSLMVSKKRPNVTFRRM